MGRDLEKYFTDFLAESLSMIDERCHRLHCTLSGSPSIHQISFIRYILQQHFVANLFHVAVGLSKSWSLVVTNG